MSIALWEYVWCLDKITVEREGVGVVLGGAPIKAAKMAADLGSAARTVRENLQRLERQGYIRRRRTPFGCGIEVLNSLKFGVWKRRPVMAENFRSDGGNLPLLAAEKRTYKEDAAGRKTAVEAAEAAGSNIPIKPCWKAMGVRPCGPEPFRRLVETRWAERNGQSLAEFMGQVLDAWDLIRGRRKRPRPFCQTLRRIREQACPVEDFPELEVVPLEVPE